MAKNKKTNHIDNYDVDGYLEEEINQILNKRVKKIKDTLVLSGGGLKGISQLGALHCLEQNNLLDDIRTIAGTSVGSMIGLMHIIGYQPLEVFNFLRMVELKHVKKLDPMNIIAKYGLDDGERMMLVLRKLITAKKFDPEMTFNDLNRMTNINFIVTGTCINEKKVYYFSHITFPNMPVLQAIRISISVPILFTPVLFENKVFVDGACIDNFPIHLFEHRMENVIGIHVADYRNVTEIKFIDQYIVNVIQCLLEGVTHRDTLLFNKHIVCIKCLIDNEDDKTNVYKLFDDGYLITQKKVDAGDFI
jgi:NTE family protein